MTQPKYLHAIWMRTTPYLIPWAEDAIGTGLKLNGKPVLELRHIPGMKQLLRNEVCEDADFSADDFNSLSQLKYEVISNGLKLNPTYVKEKYGFTSESLQSFVPVSVPEYLFVGDGAIHPFSRIMQLSRQTARCISDKLYSRFWREVYEYDQSTQHSKDIEMIDDFLELHNMPDIFLDDLRNQWQRLKRKGSFVKKH